MLPRHLRSAALAALVLLVGAAPSAQRAVKVADAWITTAGAEATAFVTIENGTMYDAYLTGAQADVAASIELMQTVGGKATVVTEIPIPAFDRVTMAAGGTYLRLKGLKKPLQSGEIVSLSLVLDGGSLSADAVVK
jgi:copper(I)-binding protein